MKLAIIGAGNVGRALAESGVRAGHSVVISASDPAHALAAAAATGAQAAPSNEEAVRDADAVVLAVPFAAVEELASSLVGTVDGKVVIDVTNPITPDFTGLAGTSAAERIQERLPEAHVVKAFNFAFAGNQADPIVDGTPLDGFVAADDEDAKAVVLELTRSIGFRPIDAGPLAMSRSLEALALLIISLQIRHGWSWQNGWKLIGPLRKAA